MYKAVHGCDFVRGKDWKPVKKSKNDWQKWAEKQAKKHTERDKFTWYPVLCWIPGRNAFRINFAGQPERIRR